ncbi:hypothetical protein EAE99_002211 [Botrytis elliptica]|nr:hypothetical protein EAE99_002211 [Botrytis elliptica]
MAYMRRPYVLYKETFGGSDASYQRCKAKQVTTVVISAKFPDEEKSNLSTKQIKKPDHQLWIV